jgi:hypothetical protein
MHERGARDPDQAAGLRRIFGDGRARLAPILVQPGQAAAQVASIVRLAQGCAASGERTLVVDCARAQVAASLGLRARFDLIHAVRGECRIEQACLDAGQNLGVVAAARAVAQTSGAAGEFLRWLGALVHGPVAADLVLLVMEPGHTPLLHTAGAATEVIVPMPRRHAAWGDLLRMLATLADGTDIAGFRLLFPAWDADTAARLYAELAKACSDQLGTALRFGGAARVAHDWLRAARAMGEWDLARLPRPQIVRTS